MAIKRIESGEQPDDVDAILSLFQRNIRAVGYVDREDVESWRCYLVSDERTVIGVALVEVDRPTAVLQSLAVKQSHRRQGVATTLLETAVDDVDKRVEVKVQTGIGANACYEACGWRFKRTTPDQQMNVWIAS